MDFIKITPDKERAKSILKMCELLKKRIALQDEQEMASLIIADYYEIIKELITALLYTDGYKTISHKNLIIYLEKHYSQFSSYEIELINELRMLRNRIVYEGFSTNPSYLKRKRKDLEKLISKLQTLVEEKLK
ncbi:MAG: hypothetical protein GXN99_02270 [Candidatus Nanohaloarchaeota archaeon]|nr:hypothetical protein [Candidatus Nanohaloarchaeota archaeon]